MESKISEANSQPTDSIRFVISQPWLFHEWLFFKIKNTFNIQLFTNQSFVFAEVKHIFVGINNYSRFALFRG